MDAPLLTTKLHFPPTRANVVLRPHLVSRLYESLSRPLAVISAPADYGKTSLLSEWRTNSGKEFPAAWLALDADDNDPACLWR
jgi:LuxR family transcriptional regulator, maltose regulon positive regulatory protein